MNQKRTYIKSLISIELMFRSASVPTACMIDRRRSWANVAQSILRRGERLRGGIMRYLRWYRSTFSNTVKDEVGGVCYQRNRPLPQSKKRLVKKKQEGSNTLGL